MAGGAGTRGRPYTDTIPKAMTRIGAEPIVSLIARHIGAHPGIEEIIVVADMAGGGAQARNYLENAPLGCPARFVQDSSSGTGGDLLCAQRAIGRGGFLLWFADNLCALDIGAMIRLYEASGRAACVAVRSRRREETGFVSLDGSDVTEFVEKPVIELARPECLGIYILGSRVLSRVRRLASGGRAVDLSYDVLAPLAADSQMCAYDIGAAGWIDAESPVVLERNADTAGRIAAQMGRRARRPGAAGAPARTSRSARRTRA